MLANLVSALLSRRAPAREAAASEEFEIVESPQLIERAFRRPFFRRGVLVCEEGQRVEIAVKDLSEGGARVEFCLRAPLPQNVMLCEPTLRLRCRAKVVWQTEGAAGLAFIDPPAASSAA